MGNEPRALVYIQLSQLFCVDICNCVLSNVEDMLSVEHSHLYYLCVTSIHHLEVKIIEGDTLATLF